jgi:predicted permease
MVGEAKVAATLLPIAVCAIVLTMALNDDPDDKVWQTSVIVFVCSILAMMGCWIFYIWARN